MFHVFFYSLLHLQVKEGPSGSRCQLRSTVAGFSRIKHGHGGGWVEEPERLQGARAALDASAHESAKHSNDGNSTGKLLSMEAE